MRRRRAPAAVDPIEINNVKIINREKQRERDEYELSSGEVSLYIKRGYEEGDDVYCVREKDLQTGMSELVVLG